MTDELDLTAIRDHYERIEPVVSELATTGEFLTIGLNDYAGWYVKRDHDEYDLIEEGYEQEGRCATLAKDYDAVRRRIDRALYALTTYDDPHAHAGWEPCTVTDGSTEWRTDAPTPGYGDLRGVMVWGDIDLVDDLKEQRGELDAETQATIEETLAAYAEEYARLYGDDSVVYALDSVGGAYIMGAPAATVPIAELFAADADARERVMETLVDRSNDWLADAQDRVEDRVEGAADVIDPDWVNNCNRQYKAPLSLHADHDAVVTPLDPETPSYDLTPVGEVTDQLVNESAQWAADLTATDAANETHAATLVKRLWPDVFAENEDWQATLTAWVQAERERERKEEEAKKRARERRRERKEQMGGGVEGQPLTPSIADVFDALDRLDIERVARKTIVSSWTDSNRDLTDNSGKGKRAFVPTWGGTANSGNANYVDTDEGIWVDTGDDYSGGSVKMALIARDNWPRGDTPSGDDWRRGIEYLRDMGFEVPVWTPDANSTKQNGEDYGEMPYWSLRKAAVALGVLPESAFIRAQDERGGYLKFPGRETYNHALAAVEDAGLTHNREYMTEDGTRPDPDSPDTDDSDVPEESETEPTDEPSASSEDTASNDFGAHSELDVETGGYGYWKTGRDGDAWFERVTNFKLDVDSFLFRDGERLIKLDVVPGTGEDSYELTVPAEVFNDARRFRDNVVKGLTTTFDGGPSDLNELRKLVGGQDAPVRTGTHHMGLHPDSGEFVTPNGVLTADGWESDPEYAYIEREIGAERAFGLNSEEHTEYDPTDVTEILELLPQSRFSQRFLPAMGWLYAAPLRPYVQDWEGQFNTLHVTGETGAGKSSTLSVLWQLLGMDGEPMACDDTKFALTTSMAATNSIPMWYDEYKPGDMKDWEVDRFQNLMRSTTRGGIATRGNADKSTEEYQLRAPLMISGEQSIQGPAEQRRTIQTRFKDGVKEPGSPTKQAFAELTGMAYDKDGQTVEPEGYDLSQHALAYYQWVLRQPPTVLKELWTDARAYVRDLFAANGITGVDDLPRQGVQTVYFGMTLYRAFAQHMAEEAGISPGSLDLPSKTELDEALLYIARQFGDTGSRKSHMDRFIELTARAATEEYLEAGKHYTFVHEGDQNEQLALKLSSVHDRVSKYVRDHGLDSEDLLNNASDYRDRMAEAAEDSDSYVVTHSQKTPPLARCARIDTGIAEETVEFSRLAFGVEPRHDGEEGEGASSDDDPDGGDGQGETADQPGMLPPETPSPMDIGDINPSQQDVASTAGTVEFGQWDGRSTDDGTPAWSATLKDGDAEAKLVVWDEEDIPKFYDETGVFQADALDVRGAKVSEYDGKTQLVVTDTTEIFEDPDDDQYQLSDTADAEQDTDDSSAVADGGQPNENTDPEQNSDDESDEPQPVRNYIANKCESNDTLSVVEVAGATALDPEDVKQRLSRLATRTRLVMDTPDGYVVN